MARADLTPMAIRSRMAAVLAPRIGSAPFVSGFWLLSAADACLPAMMCSPVLCCWAAPVYQTRERKQVGSGLIVVHAGRFLSEVRGDHEPFFFFTASARAGKMATGKNRPVQGSVM